MIESFRDGEKGPLALFHYDEIRGAEIPANIAKPLARKLDIIEAATAEQMLFDPRSNNYERLSGNLAGWSSIRISIKWRLIFQWRDGKASGLYLDPHKY